MFTKIFKASLIGALLVSSSACTTIYFHRDASQNTMTEMAEWHHDGILRLVEFSDPVDMSKRCESKPWKDIKVEKDFVKVLATGASWGLYDPWEVAYSCGQ